MYHSFKPCNLDRVSHVKHRRALEANIVRISGRLHISNVIVANYARPFSSMLGIREETGRSANLRRIWIWNDLPLIRINALENRIDRFNRVAYLADKLATDLMLTVILLKKRC